MTHQVCSPVIKLFLRKSRHERGQFGVDRPFDQLARAIAQDVSERIGRKTRWIKAAVMAVSDMWQIIRHCLSDHVWMAPAGQWRNMAHSRLSIDGV
jgi:hypothetical protein